MTHLLFYLKCLKNFLTKTNYKVKGAISSLDLIFYVAGFSAITAALVVGSKATMNYFRTVEAKTQLKQIAMKEDQYYESKYTYSNSFKDILYDHKKLVTEEGGDGLYKIEIVYADDATFLVRATMVKDIDKDGVYNVWEVDQTGEVREVIED